MITHTIDTLKLGGKAVALATLMATASFAQTATTEAPAAGMTTMDAVEFPTLSSVETDQQVAEDLVAQGYENIVIVRSDDALTVSADRGGVPTEMVFSPTEGTLILVDGVQPMAADEGTQMVNAGSTDGDEPMTETPDSTDFSGQGEPVQDTPTASIEGDETDPVAETIPVEPTVPVTGETGLDEDGGAETDGSSDNEDVTQ